MYQPSSFCGSSGSAVGPSAISWVMIRWTSSWTSCPSSIQGFRSCTLASVKDSLVETLRGVPYFEGDDPELLDESVSFMLLGQGPPNTRRGPGFDGRGRSLHKMGYRAIWCFISISEMHPESSHYLACRWVFPRFVDMGAAKIISS